MKPKEEESPSTCARNTGFIFKRFVIDCPAAEAEK